jgi:tetratricopeptide (TPR) repeat protein
LEKFPIDSELRFYRANLHHDAGRLEEAAHCFQNLLQVKEEAHFQSYDHGIDSFKARQNLAVVYTDMGDLKKAEEQWRAIVAEVPRYRAGWSGLADNLHRQGKFDQARNLADQLLKDKSLAVEGLILNSRLAIGLGDLQSAQLNLQNAVRDFPKNEQALEALSRFYFEHRNPVEAEESLKELIHLNPENASAHHNLGTVLKLKGDMGRAATEFQDSLRFRPNSAPTYFELGNTLFESGRKQEAIEAWERAQKLEPNRRDIRDAVAHAKNQTA